METREPGSGLKPPGPTVALVGPTAVGKSRLALHLAALFNGDIITADSRQVYRYMDIGTAKPTLEEQAQVRHYMLDLVEPSDTYSLARYVSEGSRVLQRTWSEGRVAFVVGGTGFYVRGLLDRLTLPAVPPNPELRRRLGDEARVHGPEALHARLAVADPRSAGRIHPRNLPRIVRALEIVDALGGPVPPSGAGSAVPALYLGLSMERGELMRVADRRVEAQVQAGLVAETQALLDMGYDPQLPPLDGFAYRQMVAYLDGRLSLEQAIDEYKAATHRYMRRQMTWFRADVRIKWLCAEPGTEERATARVRAWIEEGAGL